NHLQDAKAQGKAHADGRDGPQRIDDERRVVKQAGHIERQSHWLSPPSALQDVAPLVRLSRHGCYSPNRPLTKAANNSTTRHTTPAPHTSPISSDNDAD